MNLSRLDVRAARCSSSIGVAMPSSALYSRVLSRCPIKPSTASSSSSCSFKRGMRCSTAATGDELMVESSLSEEDSAEILIATTRKIRTLGQSGRMKDAIAALAGLAEQGVQPDTVAATTLVRACVKDMSVAQSVFDELFGGDFLQPDEVTFAVLLRGYGSQSPPDWPRIDATLTAMRNKYGIPLTATSYNPLLEVCCRTNDLDRGQDVIDRMASDGVEPDEFSAEAVGKKKVLRSYLKKTFGI